MIGTFTEITEDFKSRIINPGLHFMYNEAPIDSKIIIITIIIKYQLFLPSKHRSKHSETAIHTIKTHFMAVLYRVDKDFHLQLLDILLQMETISLNFLNKSITIPNLSDYPHIFG